MEKKTEYLNFKYPETRSAELDSLIKIAQDPDICWYCGKKADGVMDCNLSTISTYINFGHEKTVTRDYPFDIHVCKECVNRHNEISKKSTRKSLWILIPCALIAAGIFYAFYISGHNNLLYSIFMTVLFAGGLAVVAYIAFNGHIEKRTAKKYLSSEIRSLNDHPFVKTMREKDQYFRIGEQLPLNLRKDCSDILSERTWTFKEYRKD